MKFSAKLSARLSPRIAAVVAVTSMLCPVAAVAQAAHPGKTSSEHALLTGYFPQWGLYNNPQYLVKNLVTAGGAGMLDQLNYAQAFVTGGHCSIADPHADLNYTFSADQSVNGIADDPAQPFRGHLHQLAELKRLYPHLKLIISLEGRAADFATDAQPENRAAFIDSCVDLFLKGNLAPGIQQPGLFDGIDIDWEFPQAADAANYLDLLKELRQKMNAVRPGLRLNIAVSHAPHMHDGTDFAQVATLVDQVGIMTYDFHGPWDDTTGFLAPLRADASFHGGTVERSVQAYLDAGVPSSKLLLGIPFYGYGWHQVPETDNGLHQEGTAIRGDRPYRDILGLIAQSTVYRDPLSQAPWIFDGDIFWTYEDPTSIRSKIDFARQQHLGGLMIWELGEDTVDATLLHAAHTALTAPPGTLLPTSPRPVALPAAQSSLR